MARTAGLSGAQPGFEAYLLQSWRRNDPHPVFSADGKRIYYNVSDGPWTRLMVAERK